MCQYTRIRTQDADMCATIELHFASYLVMVVVLSFALVDLSLVAALLVSNLGHHHP